MLQHKDALGFQHIAPKHKVGQLWNFLQGIRGIGKDEIKLLTTSLQESEYVCSQHFAGRRNFFSSSAFELVYASGDKTMVITVQFHTNHWRAAT